MKSESKPYGLREAIALQEETIRYAMDKNSIMSEWLLDPVGLDLLKRFAASVPLEGGKSGIDLVNLLEAGDYRTIGCLFVSNAYADKFYLRELTEFEPSIIASLNAIDYRGKLSKAAIVAFERAQQEAAKEAAKQEATPMPTTAPIDTPQPVLVDGISI
jgi:hypothetical protein